MKKIPVQIYNVSGNKLPAYETLLSAGMDIRADFSRVTPTNPINVKGEGEFIFEAGVEDMEHDHPAMLKLGVGSRALIPTGLFIALPEGYEVQVRPRSGLALKYGASVINSPGTIDADYRGEIGIILINEGLEPLWIEDGERIAQIVLKEVPQIEWVPVESKDDLGKTGRNGGFGHTGVS